MKSTAAKPISPQTQALAILRLESCARHKVKINNSIRYKKGEKHND
jgi:hypothetical protein